jgi:hypothetical protein
LYIIVIVKIITGRERNRENRIVESILRKPVYATNNSTQLPVCTKSYSLAESFGNDDDHIQSPGLHKNTCISYYSKVDREPGSSVSIVSGYRLDDRAIEVRSPADAKDFSCSLCVQTGSEAHPASCPMGTGGPFPGAKARPGRDADHSSPSSVEVENKSCTSSPPKRLRGV